MARRSTWIGWVAGGLMVAAIVFLVMLFLIKVLWAWTVPSLFPGAVAQGLVAGSISWFTAFKLAIFLALLAGIAGARKGGD
ncbi:hypothetical protein JXB02_06825 [Candidatus Woesearchaeota archaeon]|nr:hypothetical protein [Candidatus Woesearchaeota archaeon]